METSPISNDDIHISTLSGQPTPLQCLASTQRGITAIARVWAPGDVPRCRLCPVCTADGDFCLVTTEDKVNDGDGAWLFARRGPPARDVAPGALRLALAR